MEYKRQPNRSPNLQPRLIIHGGAGNITPASLPPDRYQEFRKALLTIISKAHAYMTTPTEPANSSTTASTAPAATLPSAIAVAAHAVTLLEDNPLFNAGRGAVFTRDGTNELEASIMVSRGRAKRGVGVSGLRHVRNPILLARALLERGDADLAPKRARGAETTMATTSPGDDLDVPSAQGHTHLHGAAAEQLARRYGIELVPTSYFFTQRRWDEHIRGLERERAACCDGKACPSEKGEGFVSASWSKDEYLPQGTVGAVALDVDGVVCCATSTGGLTNKLSGRIGDTPTVGAGFWAEEWVDKVTRGGDLGSTKHQAGMSASLVLSGALKGLVAECLPTPWTYRPVLAAPGLNDNARITTRSVAVSGTGNGDSFLRTAAARTVSSIARFGGMSSAIALNQVAGPGGELERSAGDRWGRTGEGEGGMIGIECIVVRNDEGNVVEVRSEILQDFNCGGMFRAWVDEKGVAFARVFREDQALSEGYDGEGQPEHPRAWCGEKTG
ncbi:hypothetical protein VTK26DRAFT_9299 [Humicola hyalothermophila]